MYIDVSRCILYDEPARLSSHLKPFARRSEMFRPLVETVHSLRSLFAPPSLVVRSAFGVAHYVHRARSRKMRSIIAKTSRTDTTPQRQTDTFVYTARR